MELGCGAVRMGRAVRMRRHRRHAAAARMTHTGEVRWRRMSSRSLLETSLTVVGLAADDSFLRAISLFGFSLAMMRLEISAYELNCFQWIITCRCSCNYL
jgi:hypothetical protein